MSFEPTAVRCRQCQIRPRSVALALTVTLAMVACGNQDEGPPASLANSTATAPPSSQQATSADQPIARKSIPERYRVSTIDDGANFRDRPNVLELPVVSDNGKVAGYRWIFYSGMSYVQYPMIWDPVNGLHIFEDLLGMPRGISDTGIAIVDAGHPPTSLSIASGLQPVPGTEGRTGESRAIAPSGSKIAGNLRVRGKWMPFLWEADSGITVIPIPEDTRHGSAEFVTDSGQVFGTFDTLEGNRLSFMWTAPEGTRVFPEPGMAATIKWVSPGGVAAGVISGDDNVGRPFVWTPTDGLQTIAEWPSAYVNKAVVNDSGQAIFNSEQTRSWFWSAASGLVEIADSTPSKVDVTGIDSHGRVVGGTSRDVSGTRESRAFIWSLADGMVDLSSRIDPSLNLVPSRAAATSNKNGHIVVNASAGLFMLSEP